MNSSYNHSLSDSGHIRYTRKSKNKKQGSLVLSGLIPGWDTKKALKKCSSAQPADDEEDKDSNDVVQFGGYMNDDESDEAETKVAKAEKATRSKDENVTYQF